MISLKERIPGYLLGRYQLVATVTFTAFFSLLFLIFSIPFSHNAWFELRATDAFGFTVLFYLLSLALVIVSKRVMYVTYRKRVQRPTFLGYILWNLVEIVAICALYTAFTLKGESMGIIDNGGAPWHIVFMNSVIYGLMTLAVPYVICGMYFAIIDKDNTIRVMNYGNAVTDEVLPPREETKITLFDSGGALRFSVTSSNLYYIESDDNYVKVWYTDSHGMMKQYMLRCRLKTIEESFADSDLIRCNRKYVVNMEHVRVLRKLRENYVLELDNDAIPPLPVTKTYEENVLARFNSTYRGE
jgi:hypothetical protein